MLRPNKYTKVDVSLIAVTANLLILFQKNKSMTYTDLLNKVISQKGIESKNIFLPALNFLFLLDKIEYHEKSDVIEYKS